LNVDLNAQNSLLLRAASKFGFDTAIKDQPLSLYAKLGWANELNAKQKYNLNQNQERINFGGHWVEYSLGASLILNKTNAMFIEVGSNQGNRFDTYNANLGYKLYF